MICFVAEEYARFFSCLLNQDIVQDFCALVDEIVANSRYWAAFNLQRDVFMNSVCGFSTWEKGLERFYLNPKDVPPNDKITQLHLLMLGWQSEFPVSEFTGDVGVGATSLLYQFMRRHFSFDASELLQEYDTQGYLIQPVSLQDAVCYVTVLF